MSNSERDKQAEMRAERIRWRGRSRSMSQASQNTDERLRGMSGRASALDDSLRRHGKESAIWHERWNDSPVSG